MLCALQRSRALHSQSKDATAASPVAAVKHVVCMIFTSKGALPPISSHDREWPQRSA
jgi:hypothetical protein